VAARGYGGGGNDYRSLCPNGLEVYRDVGGVATAGAVVLSFNCSEIAIASVSRSVVLMRSGDGHILLYDAWRTCSMTAACIGQSIADAKYELDFSSLTLCRV
jgi:hypothetical protein